METLLIILSLMMIGLVLLQSTKAESAGQIMVGGGSDLFSSRKERGVELFISRLTLMTGISFFLVALLSSF